MVAQPIPVPPGVFQAEREEPARVLPFTKVRSHTDRVSVSTGPGRDVKAATVQRATAVNLPVQCLLVVDEAGEKVSLTLPMRRTPVDLPGVYYLETPRTVPGIWLAMRISAAGQGTLQLKTDYTGLDVARVISYARFVAALKRTEGRFTVSVYVKGTPRHLVTIQLPLPFEDSDRESTRQELRFWQAVQEVSETTGTKLVCPPEITDADLRNLNVVLGAVRNGWVVERVKSFTIPPTEETARNFLRIVEEEGTILKSLVMRTEHEIYKIFSAEIDLGTCIRHVAKARLLTPLDEIREWLASDSTKRGTLTTKWEPVDGTPMIVLFFEWPKQTAEEPADQDMGRLLSRKGSAPLRADASGTVRVGDTRVTLDSIAAALREGETANEIVRRYPALTVDDVNQILGWYLRYREPIGTYLTHRERAAQSLRQEIETRFDPNGVRERLPGRRGTREDEPGGTERRPS